MKKYKVSVSKGQKKYTIIISAFSEDEAKEKIHKEGYSVLGVEEFSDRELIGQKFIFQVKDKDKKEIKNGIVIGKDIFKVYLKLRDELFYDVIYLYSEQDKKSDEKEKIKIINTLQEQYNILKGVKIQDQEKEEEKNQRSLLNQEFHLKKDLEETYKLIDFVLFKLKNVIEDKNIYNLDSEQRLKFQDIYNNIIKIKKSTNAAKLKQIGELALLKIGNIELKNLEKLNTKKSKELLNETNKLLKNIGSNRQFIERNKDIKALFELYSSNFNNAFKKFLDIKNFFTQKKEEIDKSSYSYLKTVILLKKYKIKFQENSKELEKNFFLFLLPFKKNQEKKAHILLKRRVIQQNISLLEAKKSGKIYSYTFVKKGYNKIIGFVLSYFYLIKPFLFFIVIFYSFFFIISFNLQYYSLLDVNINYNGLFYFLLLIILLVFTQLSKGFISLVFNFVIFTFIFIVGVVNF
ncbi:hypothetical protein HGA92_01605 [Candidatus Gracilibacteria bacterium]|nr:hypothetical protein [Candidatus Gracilibacteria bacterium]NUJ98694.1 hypothetical protein [Candidatus Gracilibacteria bacterium]